MNVGDTVVCVDDSGYTVFGLDKGSLYTITSIGYKAVMVDGYDTLWSIDRFKPMPKINQPVGGI